VQQPENCENRNDPDLVQAFLKKWWVESYFKAPNLPLSIRFKIRILERKNIFLFNQSKTVLKAKPEIASCQSEIRYLILIIEK
jgi:hypothetical protein